MGILIHDLSSYKFAVSLNGINRGDSALWLVKQRTDFCNLLRTVATRNMGFCCCFINFMNMDCLVETRYENMVLSFHDKDNGHKEERPGSQERRRSPM